MAIYTNRNSTMRNFLFMEEEKEEKEVEAIERTG